LTSIHERDADTLIGRLRAAAGVDAVFTGATIAEYSGRVWAEGHPVNAAAVVRPRSPAQVAAVMAVGHAARQPLSCTAA
jgi:hypothetical protein